VAPTTVTRLSSPAQPFDRPAHGALDGVGRRTSTSEATAVHAVAQVLGQASAGRVEVGDATDAPAAASETGDALPLATPPRR